MKWKITHRQPGTQEMKSFIVIGPTRKEMLEQKNKVKLTRKRRSPEEIKEKKIQDYKRKMFNKKIYLTSEELKHFNELDALSEPVKKMILQTIIEERNRIIQERRFGTREYTKIHPPKFKNKIIEGAIAVFEKIQNPEIKLNEFNIKLINTLVQNKYDVTVGEVGIISSLLEPLSKAQKASMIYFMENKKMPVTKLIKKIQVYSDFCKNLEKMKELKDK